MKEQDDKPLLQGDLADKLGVRVSTIKFYTQLGLLPYDMAGKGCNRYFDYKTAKSVMDDIGRLKGKGYRMADIVKLYASEGKLSRGIDLTVLNLPTFNETKEEA